MECHPIPATEYCIPALPSLGGLLHEHPNLTAHGWSQEAAAAAWAMRCSRNQIYSGHPRQPNDLDRDAWCVLPSGESTGGARCPNTSSNRLASTAMPRSTLRMHAREIG